MHLLLRFSFLFIVLSCTIVSAEIPLWAQKQIDLRNKLQLCIEETQKWQNNDGSIYEYLSLYKWDDEVEIFYGWPIYYLYTGDESVYESAKGIAFSYLNRAEQDFEHGYYPEPFFDTEHTLEGLTMLASLAFVKPSDSEVVTVLVDLAEHFGNWVPGYAEWFDENTGHIKSLRPGTTRVNESCDGGVDWPFNLGFAKIALAAYHATEDDRYLTWVGKYLDGWIDSMERNEQENGYYLLPAEVSPLTGELGPCSEAWYFSAFEPGWGWQENGNNSNRDMYGPFLDYYSITKNEKYLNAQQKHIWTLFNNGSNNTPAHYYNGTSWTAQSDKVTARMAVKTSLFSGGADEAFEQYMDSWNYRQEDYLLWDYRFTGEISIMEYILNEAIKDADVTLGKLRGLTSLPSAADDFPDIREIWGISLSAFGGVLANRGEMPWTEALYFKADGSLGLEAGVAALVADGDDSKKVVYLSNTNGQDKTIKLQANFRPANITGVTVNDLAYSNYDLNKAIVNVPAGETIKVELYIFDQDTIPPNMPTNTTLVENSETSIQFEWDEPVPAEDGDLPREYIVKRDGILVTTQNTLSFNDTGLIDDTSYEYEILSIDKVGNKSQVVSVTFSTKVDVTPPIVTRVVATDEYTVEIFFNESVNAPSAGVLSNYAISPEMSVTEAYLLTNNVVVLTTSKHIEGQNYTLTMANVKDDSKNKNVILQNTSIQYAFVEQLIISNVSPEGYFIAYKEIGDSLYSDREYKITNIPESLKPYHWIVTKNDDKTATGVDFLQFSINKTTTVYVGYDANLVSENIIPDWLTGWQKTDLIIESDDTDFICFQKSMLPTLVSLGANQGGSSSSMYIVLVDPLLDIVPPSPPTGFSISTSD